MVQNYLLEKKRVKIPLNIPKQQKLDSWVNFQEVVNKLDPFILSVLYEQDNNSQRARFTVFITTNPKLKTQAEEVQMIALNIEEFAQWTKKKEGLQILLNNQPWNPEGYVNTK